VGRECSRSRRRLLLVGHELREVGPELAFQEMAVQQRSPPPTAVFSTPSVRRRRPVFPNALETPEISDIFASVRTPVNFANGRPESLDRGI
jgi:hypothetical protein